MNKLIEIIPDDLPDWMIKAMAEGQLFNTILKRDHDKQGWVSVEPMSTAPRDTEILAFHIEGKTWHQVKWRDHPWMDGSTQFWGVRWNEDYKQYDSDYSGWQSLPSPPEE